MRDATNSNAGDNVPIFVDILFGVDITSGMDMPWCQYLSRVRGVQALGHSFCQSMLDLLEWGPTVQAAIAELKTLHPTKFGAPK